MPEVDNAFDPQDEAEIFDETHGVDEDPTGAAPDDVDGDPAELTAVFDVTSAVGDADEDGDEDETADDYDDDDLRNLDLDDEEDADEDDSDALDDDLEDEPEFDAQGPTSATSTPSPIPATTTSRSTRPPASCPRSSWPISATCRPRPR
jgi:hypothetical protein